jgi:hypothetical protein
MPPEPPHRAAGIPPSNEHVFLVAFDITECTDREDAQRWLMSRLGEMLTVEHFYHQTHPDSILPHIDSWWVAEDDRLDGSDNDSAVFVPYRPMPPWDDHNPKHDEWVDEEEEENQQ